MVTLCLTTRSGDIPRFPIYTGQRKVSRCNTTIRVRRCCSVTDMNIQYYDRWTLYTKVNSCILLCTHISHSI